MMSRQFKLILVFICILSLLNGCASSPKYVDESVTTSEKTAFNFNTVYFKKAQSFTSSPPQCIAVLPLNISDDQLAKQTDPATKSRITLTSKNLQQLRWILYSHLAPRPYRDIELNHINKHIGSDKYTPKIIKTIGEALNCDALLLGKVTDYHSDFLGVYSQISIGIELKLLQAKDSKILWEAKHTVKSHAGSLPFTPIDILIGLYSATENVSDEQVVRVADNLFRRLLSTWEPAKNASTLDTNMADNEPFPLHVIANKLFLRSGPGQKFKHTEILNRNEKLALLDDKNAPWLQVKVAGGKIGYVHATFIALAP